MTWRWQDRVAFEARRLTVRWESDSRKCVTGELSCAPRANPDLCFTFHVSDQIFAFVVFPSPVGSFSFVTSFSVIKPSFGDQTCQACLPVKDPAVSDPLFVHSDLKTTLKNNRKAVKCEPHSNMKVKQSEVCLLITSVFLHNSFQRGTGHNPDSVRRKWRAEKPTV